MSSSESPRRPLDLRAVWVLLKKEFLDNVRNRWIIALSAIFFVLTLVWSYFGATQAGGGTGFQGLVDTVVGMTAIATILIPILGLMVSYAAVVGEKDRGSILLLLSMPITRLETILGKFLGLGAVMLTAVLSGLGIGGIVIMTFTGTEGWENFIVFLLGAIIFSLAFLSIGLLLLEHRPPPVLHDETARRGHGSGGLPLVLLRLHLRPGPCGGVGRNRGESLSPPG
ncbi:MAG: ABC transporter permease [Thermoplasmata archaeon]